MKASNPFLHFHGNCLEAFEFYKSIFGGEFGPITRYSDVPQEQKNQVHKENPEDNRIMHMSLPLGETTLMGSDIPAQFPELKLGNATYQFLVMSSANEADNVFEGLGRNGKVLIEMHHTFWGAYFGMVADKYGHQWMISYDENNT